MIKILKDYLEYIPGRIIDLEKAFNNGDASSLERQAHKLKGLSANIGT
jgi:HPt (histidine-containing phosphotransfer) domain-containing protein